MVKEVPDTIPIVDTAMENEKKDLVTGSGMLTHLRTVEALRKHGWTVNISSYYYDDVSDSPREIDIVAEKEFNSWERRAESTKQLNVQLFIECKYLVQEIALWFDDMNRWRAINAAEDNTGREIVEFRNGGDLASSEFHQLRGKKVAKLFSSNLSKEDVIYKALSQCLKALVYYQDWANGPLIHSFLTDHGAETKIVRFPVIVFDNFSNLRELTFDVASGNHSTVSIFDNFLIETNYVHLDKTKSRAKDQYFLVDCLNIEKLPEYLTALDGESKRIMESIRLRP